MNQDFETQLQVVQRALGEVVLPALQNADKHVIEQLHLSLAAIGFMRQRLPHARRYYRGTLQHYLELSAAIVALLPADAGDLALLAAEGRAVLDDPSSTDADFRAATGVLRAKIAATVEAGQGTAQESALDALIMDHSERILMEDRAWCVPLGFELRPDELSRRDWDK